MTTQPSTSPATRLRCCRDCVFCLWDPSLWMRTMASGFPVAGLCANHVETPGQVRAIPQGGPCRNFRPVPRPAAVEPPSEPDETIRYLPLTRGRHALVDAADYETLSRYKWSLHDAGKGKAQYAVRGNRGRKLFMHREIMQPAPGMVVDHINRNGLDNRRANLRVCTRLQNLQNRYWNAGQSQYRGVSPQGDKWMATVGYKGKTIYVGLFDDEIEAARARDQKAHELAGDFAYLNFPNEIKDQAGDRRP